MLVLSETLIVDDVLSDAFVLGTSAVETFVRVVECLVVEVDSSEVNKLVVKAAVLIDADATVEEGWV